jgi:hypothetical protein
MEPIHPLQQLKHALPPQLVHMGFDRLLMFACNSTFTLKFPINETGKKTMLPDLNKETG